jgi:hypothetical protein
VGNEGARLYGENFNCSTRSQGPSSQESSQKTFARISGYCEQTDVHSPQITVGESVAYSAWLRLPTEIDIKTRNVSYTYRSNELYTKIQLHNYVSQVLEATRSDFNMTLFLFSLTGICQSSS